ATVRLRYVDSELNGNSEASLTLWKLVGLVYVDQGFTTRDTTNNWVELTGILAANLSGDWTLDSVAERTTTTTVDCPANLAVNQTGTCTATVTDTDAGTKSDPSGSVDFSRTGPGGGSFSAASCTLVSDGNALTFTSSCSVTYTPTSGSGSHVVRGDYNEAS